MDRSYLGMTWMRSKKLYVEVRIAKDNRKNTSMVNFGFFQNQP